MSSTLLRLCTWTCSIQNWRHDTNQSHPVPTLGCRLLQISPENQWSNYKQEGAILTLPSGSQNSPYEVITEALQIIIYSDSKSVPTVKTLYTISCSSPQPVTGVVECEAIPWAGGGGSTVHWEGRRGAGPGTPEPKLNCWSRGLKWSMTPGRTGIKVRVRGAEAENQDTKQVRGSVSRKPCLKRCPEWSSRQTGR